MKNKKRDLFAIKGPALEKLHLYFSYSSKEDAIQKSERLKMNFNKYKKTYKSKRAVVVGGEKVYKDVEIVENNRKWEIWLGSPYYSKPKKIKNVQVCSL
jgi:hypothetical protein